MVRTGVTAQDLALCCGVDPKTIERWISPGRVPHRTHRWAAARRLGYEESYLWPEIRRSPARRAEAACSELVCLYPDRASVPRGVWLRLMTSAAEHIDVLVFSGTFYAQTQPKVAAMLAAAAERGIEVRLCFGDPASDAVATRDREEGLGGTLAAKIRSALTCCTCAAWTAARSPGTTWPVSTGCGIPLSPGTARRSEAWAALST